MSSQEQGGGVGGDWMKSRHPYCVSKYLRQNIKRTSVLIHINSPSYMSAPFIGPPNDSNLCTTLPGCAPDFSTFFLTVHPQLSRWHVVVPSWYKAAEVQAVPVCLWVCNVSVQLRDKRVWCKSDQTPLAQIVKGRLWLTNASKGFVYDGYSEVNIGSTVLQMSWIYLLTDLLINTSGAFMEPS